MHTFSLNQNINIIKEPIKRINNEIYITGQYIEMNTHRDIDLTTAI